MLPATVEALCDDRRRSVVVPKRSLLRLYGVVGCVCFFVGALYLWTRRENAVLQHRALADAHEASVQLVHSVMALQSELDAQEDHDRWAMQLYLKLIEHEVPAMRSAATKAASGCPADAKEAVEKELATFHARASQHAREMVGDLSREGARTRTRAKELAAQISALARADRERLRSAGASPGWSDVDLHAPLDALGRKLRRPNATFELPEEELKAWEAAAAEAQTGAVDGDLAERIRRLSARAPLPSTDPMRIEIERERPPTGWHAIAPHFVALLQRARLHRHAAELLGSLDAWQAHTATVWDVVDELERLRGMRVFPMSMLALNGLGDKEWAAMLADAAGQKEGTVSHFEADQ